MIAIVALAFAVAAHAEAPIIGGTEVAADDPIAASTVAILSQTAQARTLCSGSIIASDLILTAGHCVEPGAIRTSILFGRNADTPSAERRMAGALRPDDYGQGTNDRDMHDIGVVYFLGGLPAGFRAAIPLTSDEIARGALTDGVPVTLAGYGDAKTDPVGILRKVSLRIRTAVYGKTEVEVDQSHGAGACHGDSGGPAYVTLPDATSALFGIDSRGPANEPDDCSGTAIYTNVAYFKDFIAYAAKTLRGN